MEIKTLNEDEVMELLQKGLITQQDADNYFKSTSIYGRVLNNNSVWDQLLESKHNEVSKDAGSVVYPKP